MSNTIRGLPVRDVAATVGIFKEIAHRPESNGPMHPADAP